MAIVGLMFAVYLIVYDIFANQEKCQNFDLDNKNQGQGVEIRNLRHSTTDVRIHIGEFFGILATWHHTFAEMYHTRT